MPDYGSGSFLLKGVGDYGSHAEWVATPPFEPEGQSSETSLLGQSSTEGTRLFVGNLTVHSSEVPNTAFGIDWLLW